jgi:hypothetical protein
VSRGQAVEGARVDVAILLCIVLFILAEASRECMIKSQF